MNCIKWRFLSWGVGLLGSIPFAIGFLSDNFWSNPFSYVGVVLLLISLIIGIVKFRCPSCGRHITDRSPLDISNCPYCGEKLK